MSKKSILCIVPDAIRAQSVVTDLRGAGFSHDDISVLLPDRSGSRELGLDKGTKAPEGATAGGVAGGAVGGALGWLVGMGALVIPGVGPLIAAGPILAALSGAAVGAAAGGAGGALIGLGVPEIEARQYEGRLKEGKVLISVHVVDKDAEKRARDVLERHKAESIHTTREASTPEPSKPAPSTKSHW